MEDLRILVQPERLYARFEVFDRVVRGDNLPSFIYTYV